MKAFDNARVSAVLHHALAVVTTGFLAASAAVGGAICFRTTTQHCCDQLIGQPGGPDTTRECPPGNRCWDQFTSDPIIMNIYAAPTGRADIAEESPDTCTWKVYACVNGVCKPTATTSHAPCTPYKASGADCGSKEPPK
jgi:hypothetical protein